MSIYEFLSRLEADPFYPEIIKLFDEDAAQKAKDAAPGAIDKQGGAVTMTPTGTPRTGPRRTNGSKLAAARIAAGLTQGQLAERIGLSTDSSIRHWETGYRKPKLETLMKIAAVLDVPWTDLYEDGRP